MDNNVGDGIVVNIFVIRIVLVGVAREFMKDDTWNIPERKMYFGYRHYSS